MPNQDATDASGARSAEAQAATAPVWIKIERTFPMVSASYSTDGVAFIPLGAPAVVPMSPAPINIGLAVTSHSGAETYATAVFSEISSDGGVVAGPLTSAEIGLTGNAAAPMSLVLTDASGATAAVVNPDPAATQQTSATDFVVDFRDFAIDMTAVVKATLVIGDGTAGGSGSITVNNVRLLGKQPLIVWVSDNKNPDPADGTPADQAWVDLLVSQGYKVDLSFRNAEGRTLDAAKIEALNAADLIIISRDTDSGSYDNGNAPTEWNSIETPIMMQIAHIARSNRWLWLDSGSTNDAQPTLQAVDVSHPIFDGVSLDAGNQVEALTTNTSFVSTTEIGNGTLIAKRADNDQIWIAEWQAEQEFYSGAGQTAAGKRLLLCSGGTSGVTDGTYNLTADGETMFLNAVSLLLAD